MIELPRPAAWPTPDPAPLPPGPSYEPPLATTTTTPAGAPQIYEHSGDAGPGQSFFVVGTGLSERVFAWGRDATTPGSDAILWRRNYACFWNLVDAPEQPAIAFRVDRPEATFAIEENAIEGSDNPTGQKIIQLRTPEDNA